MRDLAVFASRFRARLIREIMHKGGIVDDGIISVLFDELESTLNFSRGLQYSALSHTESIHDRDGLPQGHTFQERYVYSIEDVILDSHTGILFSGEGQIISESTSWPKSHILLNSIPKPIGASNKRLPIEGNSVINLPSNGFYHWLVEDLPPFLFSIQQSNSSIVLVYENAPAYVESIVSRLSVQVVRVPRFVRLENYTFTSKGPDTGYPHPVDLTTLRTFFSMHLLSVDPKRKVYVSRVRASRSPDFERELIELLRAQNWTILETEGMPLVDQIKAISTASVLSGVHGAGLVGMIWMAPGSNVIELGPNRFVPCFSRMCAILDLNYLRIGYENPRRLSAIEIAGKINVGLQNL